MIKLSSQKYAQLVVSVESLEWCWMNYEKRCPNDWYHFKYQAKFRTFIEKGGAEVYLSQISQLALGNRRKVSATVYKELLELIEISQELQDILEHPPYGSHLPDSLKQAELLIRQNEHK